MSIIEHFKSTPLVTSIGTFVYLGDIGEGGNAKVLAFKKGNICYAVKFLKHDRKGSLARFQDEFFCAAQIPSHRNISRAYHLDKTNVEGIDYSLIVMKRYDASLQTLGDIFNKDDDTKADLGWNLLLALCHGVEHLHANGIIHRDIKPQNIFADQQEETFVLGDLGIAHFAEDRFAREAKTQKAERLANYLCCAPEQLGKAQKPAPTMDIFAIGQVLNWYIRGTYVRGGGRQLYSGPVKELALLDKIIDRCIQDDPGARFQTVDEIATFALTSRRPHRDVWQPIRDLDEAFRESIPRMPEVYETTDQDIINRFLQNFAKRSKPGDFWFVRSDGGDSALSGITKLDSRRWLLHDVYEIIIEKLICYKYPGLWQSFFVLLVAADVPFELTDPDGQIIARPKAKKQKRDASAFYVDRYIDLADAENGYLQHGKEMIRIDGARAQERIRFLRRDALLIVPGGTGPAGVTDRTPNEVFLKKLAVTGTTTKNQIRKFIEGTRSATSHEIINSL